MVHFRFRRLLRGISTLAALFPVSALAARQLPVTIGTPFDLQTIVGRIVTFLAGSITAVATAMFLVGAFMIVLSGAKEDFKQKGKDLMLGSLMSIGVVLGAYALYRTVGYFLQ